MNLSYSHPNGLPNSPMKKPIVLHIVYSGFGGIASVFFSLVEASRNDNVEHVVAFYGVEPLVDDYKNHCTELGIEFRFFHRKPRLDLTINNSLNQWIFDVDPVAVIVNLPRSLKPVIQYRAKKPSVKIIGVEHHPNQLKRWVDWWDSARFSQHCDNVVYLTNAYRVEVQGQLGSRYINNKSVIIPNGINTDKFAPVDPEVNVDISQVSPQPLRDAACIKIGMCTRLSDNKDIDTLIHAIAVLRDQNKVTNILLTLAGDGPYLNHLESLVAELQLGAMVRFEGFLAESELIEWLQQVDIYAHATLAETMSTSIMQALASGLPCVVSDLPGMNELVVPGTGKLVPTKNAEALASACFALIMDDSLRLKMAAKARSHAVESLSQQASWNSYRKIINLEPF